MLAKQFVPSKIRTTPSIFGYLTILISLKEQ